MDFAYFFTIYIYENLQRDINIIIFQIYYTNFQVINAFIPTL